MQVFIKYYKHCGEREKNNNLYETRLFISWTRNRFVYAVEPITQNVYNDKSPVTLILNLKNVNWRLSSKILVDNAFTAWRVWPSSAKMNWFLEREWSMGSEAAEFVAACSHRHLHISMVVQTSKMPRNEWTCRCRLIVRSVNAWPNEKRPAFREVDVSWCSLQRFQAFRGTVTRGRTVECHHCISGEVCFLRQ